MSIVYCVLRTVYCILRSVYCIMCVILCREKGEQGEREIERERAGSSEGERERETKSRDNFHIAAQACRKIDPRSAQDLPFWGGKIDRWKAPCPFPCRVALLIFSFPFIFQTGRCILYTVYYTIVYCILYTVHCILYGYCALCIV